MSSSTYTPNYHLSQFQPEDTPDWLEDYNPDMAKIDAALHELSGITEPLAEELNALTARVVAEESANELQQEQIEHVMTGVNRITENDNKQELRINRLSGELQSAETRIAALEDASPGTASELTQIKQNIETIQTVVDRHSTSIAAAQTDITTAQQTADAALNKMSDFNMVTETEFTPAAQVTGTMKVRSTWHNLRQFMIDGELHEMASLEHVESVGYVLASADGKVFNTHWPEGSEERPNTTFNPIGSIYASGEPLDSTTPQIIMLGWHYDVTNNKTLLVMNTATPGDDFNQVYATGRVFGTPMAIYD